MSTIHVLQSRNADETLALGRRIGGSLAGGDMVALSGPLGAGKTLLVRGLAAGLGVPPSEPIVSPTFVLIREYQGRLRLYHIDAYRLQGPDELWDLGIQEMLADPQAVVAVEWPERVEAALPLPDWQIEIEYLGIGERRVTVRSRRRLRDED